MSTAKVKPIPQSHQHTHTRFPRGDWRVMWPALGLPACAEAQVQWLKWKLLAGGKGVHRLWIKGLDSFIIMRKHLRYWLQRKGRKERVQGRAHIKERKTWQNISRGKCEDGSPKLCLVTACCWRNSPIWLNWHYKRPIEKKHKLHI